MKSHYGKRGGTISNLSLPKLWNFLVSSMNFKMIASCCFFKLLIIRECLDIMRYEHLVYWENFGCGYFKPHCSLKELYVSQSETG